jgi:hypothetical protein
MRTPKMLTTSKFRTSSLYHGIEGHEDVGPFHTDGGLETGAALLGKLFPHFLEEIRKLRPGDA